ncbi:MAG: glycoside hydrolase family 88 protein [Chitinophagaceae bacterium]|nr:glycoside hydrolase family 88 protein [Chitinophagaceae bacterium]
MQVLFRLFTILLFLPLSLCAVTNNEAPPEDSVSFKPKSIRKVMERVADWQLNSWKTTPPKYAMTDWVAAAGYTGILALSDISKSKKYVKSLVKIGEKLDWNTGPRRFFADDYCIGQTYSILYMKYQDEKMIARWRQLADSIVTMPHTESLEWKKGIVLREWAWCDALFMGPTALGYLATATGEQKYLDIASQLWWKTTDYLYDSTEHLYFRDGSFLDKKEKNGRKVFWSRGNGWVLAGLARVLVNMPADYKDRARFEALYKDMAATIISLQQPDGSWYSSLLDPSSYNIKETSGTGFYAYALLWGMNNGLLSKEATWPVVKKAWGSLVIAVQPDGKLGYVQPIGFAPDKVDANSTEAYGVGAFLLAGSELHKFIGQNSALAAQ